MHDGNQVLAALANPLPNVDRSTTNLDRDARVTTRSQPNKPPGTANWWTRQEPNVDFPLLPFDTSCLVASPIVDWKCQLDRGKPSRSYGRGCRNYAKVVRLDVSADPRIVVPEVVVV